MATVAYFVVSEAVTNAVKHSCAEGITVTVDRNENILSVRIQDDGWGGANASGKRADRAGAPGRRPGRPVTGGQPGRRTHHDHRGVAVRVVLADDSTLLREGLVRLLTEEDHEVTAAVADAAELMTVLERAPAEQRPDVVVVDVRMPPTHTDEGLRAAVQIRERWPDVGVLVLSQYVERRYATELLTEDSESVGYLLKDRVVQVDEFLDALERVGSGKAAFDSEVVRVLFSRSSRTDPLNSLTAREREVLAQMAEGHTNAAIAGRLHISQSAVEKHTNAIFDKLGLAGTSGYSRRVLAVLRYLGT